MTEAELKEQLASILDDHDAYSKDLFNELYDLVQSNFEVEEDDFEEENDE